MNFFTVSLLRCTISVILGGVIGMERARHGRAAGIRTHIIVCIGACLTALTSVYLSEILGLNGDFMRLPAQVISASAFWVPV